MQTVVHPKDLERHAEKFPSAMAAGELFEFESRFRRADGQYRWFLTRAVPLRDGNGRIAKWYSTSIEIEDRKRAEQLHADLAHTNRVTTMCELSASLAHRSGIGYHVFHPGLTRWARVGQSELRTRHNVFTLRFRSERSYPDGFSQ